MKEAYKIVSRYAKNKDMYHKISSSNIPSSVKPGDHVLIRTMSQRVGSGELGFLGRKRSYYRFYNR